MSDQGAQRQTISAPVSLSGLGVISGRTIAISLKPCDSGIIFKTPGGEVGLRPGCGWPGPSWTEISSGQVRVRLVEHLLAAAAGLGVTDLLVELDGDELPLLDGSASPWVDALLQAGLRPLPGPARELAVPEPVLVADPDSGACLAAIPAPDWRICYTLRWPEPVGLEAAALDVGDASFATHFAPARTFAREGDIRAALDAGIFRAGSEDNVIVLRDDGAHQPQPVAAGFAKHKLLDMLGDLYTCGARWRGLFVAFNSGHRHNHELVRKLLEKLSPRT